VEYRTVFDIAGAGFKSWSFSAFGLIFVALGAGLVVYRKRFPGWWRHHPRMSGVFAFSFFGFAMVWTIVSFVSTHGQYSKLASAARDGRTELVEGVVTNFKPMPASGHAMERFCVRERCFEYSDFVVTAGFNNTTSHGGPIHEGLPVRLTFVGHDIVKLEIAARDR